MYVLNVLVVKSASANRAPNPGSVPVDIIGSIGSASDALPNPGGLGTFIIDILGRLVLLGFGSILTTLHCLSVGS